MRIKSYFAPSVQNAIGLARREFGDDVTLVTSHVAPLESRHLGEYEVVFAIEEPAAVAEVIKAASVQPFEFKQVLEEAVNTVEAPVTVDIPAKLDRIRSLLIEVGIDAPMVGALMTMIRRCARAPVACEDFDEAEDTKPAEPEPQPQPEPVPGNEAVTDESAIAVPEVDPVAAANPQFTAAELAFFRSVARG